MNNIGLKSSHSYQGLPHYLQQRTDSPDHRQSKPDFMLSNEYRQISITYKQSHEEIPKDNYSPLTFNLNAPPRSKLRKGYYPGFKAGGDARADEGHKNDDSWSKRVEDFSKTSTKVITNWSNSSNKSLMTPRSTQRQEEWNSAKKQPITQPYQSGLYAKPESILREGDIKSTQSTTSKENIQGHLDGSQYSTLLQQNQFQKRTIDNLHNEIVKMKNDLGLPEKRDHQKWSLSRKSSQLSQTMKKAKSSQEQLQGENRRLKEQIQKMQQDAVNKNQLNLYLEGQCKHYIASYEKNISQNKAEGEAWKRKENSLEKEIQSLNDEITKLKKTQQQTEKDYQYQRDEIARLNRCVDAQALKLAEQENNMEVDKSEINLLMMKLQNIQSKNQQLSQNYRDSLLKTHQLTQELDAQKAKTKASEDLQRQVIQYKALLEQLRAEERERREAAYKEEAAGQEAFKILEQQVSQWQQKYYEKQAKFIDSQSQRVGLESYIQSLESVQKSSIQEQEASNNKYVDQLHRLNSHNEVLKIKEKQLSQELLALERKNQKAEASRQKLKAKLEAAQIQYNEDSTQIADLTQQLKIAAEEIEKLGKQIEAQDISLREYEVRVGQMVVTLNDSKSEITLLMSKIQVYEQQKISFLQIIQVLKEKTKGQQETIRQRQQRLENIKQKLQTQQSILLQKEQSYIVQLQSLQDQIISLEQQKQSIVKTPQSPVKEGNYIQVDREGINYICEILDCQPEEGHILNTIIQRLIARMEFLALNQHHSQCYSQLLQILGIEDSPNCQQQVLKQIEGIRQSLSLLIGRVKELEFKSEELAKQNRSLLKHKKNEKASNETTNHHNARMNQLNEVLSEELIKANAKICNARMQTKEMLSSWGGMMKGQPNQHQISIEEQFFTAKTMGDIEC